MMSDAFNRATRGFGVAAFFLLLLPKRQVVIADTCGEPHCVEERPQLLPLASEICTETLRLVFGRSLSDKIRQPKL